MDTAVALLLVVAFAAIAVGGTLTAVRLYRDDER
jgi:hypothetical protein